MPVKLGPLDFIELFVLFFYGPFPGALAPTAPPLGVPAMLSPGPLTFSESQDMEYMEILHVMRVHYNRGLLKIASRRGRREAQEGIRTEQ
jgi:hypothetical protein